VPAFVHCVTKYDPADRDERGSYTGAEDTDSDHGPVEAAYLRAAAGFAEECGIDRLTVRHPEAAGDTTDLLKALFPDLRGFHDGAEVPLSVALELVRLMLRGDGGWCVLEAGDEFFVHVGYDQYMYIGADRPCEHAVAGARALGLFPEPIPDSPYSEESDGPGEQRPADEEFWARVGWLVSTGRAGVLEEGYVRNASRWHHLTPGTIDAVRAGLAPRALLTVWPPLSTDVAAVLASSSEDYSLETVWEDGSGVIRSTTMEGEELAAHLAGARAAIALPMAVDEHRPLASAVRPDEDGVLRATWRTTPAPCDRVWELLKRLRPGETVAGPVVEITGTGVVLDIDGLPARIDRSELSSRPFRHPSDVVSMNVHRIGVILGVDLVREELSLSLKAFEEIA